MNPPYAVAGRDIEQGMTVVLAPGDASFVVQKVEPDERYSWVYAYNEDGFPNVVYLNHWYAQFDEAAS